MIIIAAAIITDSQGRCLLVRKRGTEYFMQPGGKPEIGETPHAALIRELEGGTQLQRLTRRELVR